MNLSLHDVMRPPTFPVAAMRLPGTRRDYYMRALGRLGQPTAAEGQAIGGGILATGSQVMAGNYVTAVGSALMTGAAIPSPASPFLAVAGAVASLLGSIGIGKGCGQTCIQATQYVNQAEPYLQQNLRTYMSLPAPRYQSAQAAALAVFDEIWNGVVKSCSNPALGAAGQRCITDRQAGSCKWKDASGQCWNWFVGYRDPIAADQTIPDPPATASPTSSGSTSSTGGGSVVGVLGSIFSPSTGGGFGSGGLLLLLGAAFLVFGASGGSRG